MPRLIRAVALTRAVDELCAEILPLSAGGCRHHGLANGLFGTTRDEPFRWFAIAVSAQTNLLFLVTRERSCRADARGKYVVEHRVVINGARKLKRSDEDGVNSDRRILRYWNRAILRHR
jgi:hypothetical protein